MKKIIFLFLLFSLFFFDTSLIFSKKIELSEQLNRRLYSFNRGMDNSFWNISKNFYIYTVPQECKNNITTFFYNLYDFKNLLFILFYFDLQNFGATISRIIINYTYGFLGFFDLAEKNNIRQINFCMNRIFNFSNSRYMFLPALGPGTLKSNLNLFLVQLFNPFIYIFNDYFIYYFFEITYEKSNLDIDIDFFHYSMVDGYSFLKYAYIQNNGFLQESENLFDEPPE